MPRTVTSGPGGTRPGLAEALGPHPAGRTRAGHGARLLDAVGESADEVPGDGSGARMVLAPGIAPGRER
ncbi:hypothetical protein [Streptomyces thermoalcalitolerans]